ncbi:MAG: molecular chaperone, partial [Clostridia bacterium]|nr:molecular chaperone [Clostridia bacterium]
YEKETVILTSEADDTYSVFTFNTALKNRLAKFSEKYPELCRLKETTNVGSVTYTVAKGRLSIRLTAPYSEERRKAASENARKHGFNT